VARHAEATKVEISLSNRNGYVLLEIHDNGKGVTKEMISSSTSLGLLGMRERAYVFGGEVKIESGEGRGTTVTVQIPILQKQRAKSRENGAKSRENGAKSRENGAKGKNRRVEVRSELEECE
jgi:signal transduction histidine kinase